MTYNDWNAIKTKQTKPESCVLCVTKLYQKVIGFIWWYINHCGLFDAKSYYYIYIKYKISKDILEIHTIKWSNISISNCSI